MLRPVGSWGWGRGNQILLCRGSFLANCFVCCFMKPYFGFALLLQSYFYTVSVWNGAKCQLQCWRVCASQQSQQMFEFCPFFEPYWWLLTLFWDLPNRLVTSAASSDGLSFKKPNFVESMTSTLSQKYHLLGFFPPKACTSLSLVGFSLINK